MSKDGAFHSAQGNSKGILTTIFDHVFIFVLCACVFQCCRVATLPSQGLIGGALVALPVPEGLSWLEVSWS